MKRFLLLYFLSGSLMGLSQSIRINEVVGSNSTLLDEDGDTPDWFELYNSSANPIDLTGWSVTDNVLDTLKWVFNGIQMAEDQYLFIWASGKDRNQYNQTRTLIKKGDDFKYIIPVSEPANNWINLGFDDSSWQNGISGFGYGDNDDNTLVPPGTTSIFLRKSFQIANKNLIQQLILDVDYDDGFIAYLNGTEIARSNVTGTRPTFNSVANAGREAGTLQRWFLNIASLLQNGENILSFQVHNVGSTSSDLSLIPYLSAKYTAATTEGVIPPSELGLFLRPHTNFKISSSGETIYLFDQNKVLIDSLYSGRLSSNLSIGFHVPSDTLAYFQIPTPEWVNETQAFKGFLDNTIIFSNNGGLLTSPISLVISSSNLGAEIRYTLDGTEPNSSSTLYQSPINISVSTTVRAKAFKANHISGSSQSRSYFFNISNSLPIFSIITDANNLFHPDSGMYVLGSAYTGTDYPYFGSNIWEDWERPANISLYESDNEMVFNSNAGIKIFGGWSRANPQRSFSLFARSELGADSFEYPFFSELNYSSFQALVLRNSGNDWNRTQFRDVALTSLMKGAGIEYQSAKPVATYINGDYWGIYNLREKVNEHFLASKSGVDAERIDLLQANAEIINGDNTEYLQLRQFIESNSMVMEGNYKQVENQIDFEDMIKYFLAQIYYDNTDWPGNNIKFWKHPDTKWRWVLYDTDFGFGIWDPGRYNFNTLAFALDANGPGWPNPPWSTLVFRKLVENTVFRNRFINQYADELNSRYLPSEVISHIDEVSNRIKNEMPQHKARWGGSVADWNAEISNMKNFARLRPNHARAHIRSVFNLKSSNNINFNMNIENAGILKINSLNIEEVSWDGIYFEDVPITVTAIPKEGYIFSHWTGASTSLNPKIEINPTNGLILTAHFIKNDQETLPIVINEINYNSDQSWPAGDWIELYNPNNFYVDISGYQISDSDPLSAFTMEENTLLAGHQFIILTRDLASFTTLYPNVTEVKGNFTFGLSSGGDEVSLYTKSGNLVDRVAYLPTAPWPLPANGDGPTLELISPELDNSLGVNWKSGKKGGSPGEINLLDQTIYGSIDIFPNPFSDVLNIDFVLKQEGVVQIKMTDLAGRQLNSITNGFYAIGQHSLTTSLYGIPNGMYILTFNDGDHIKSFRLIKRD